jgi:hypothetical protein
MVVLATVLCIVYVRRGCEARNIERVLRDLVADDRAAATALLHVCSPAVGG